MCVCVCMYKYVCCEILQKKILEKPLHENLRLFKIVFFPNWDLVQE